VRAIGANGTAGGATRRKHANGSGNRHPAPVARLRRATGDSQRASRRPQLGHD
jgi:hypothetical protein